MTTTGMKMYDLTQDFALHPASFLQLILGNKHLKHIIKYYGLAKVFTFSFLYIQCVSFL